MKIVWMVLAYPVVLLIGKLIVAMLRDILDDFIPEGRVKEYLFRERDL